MSSLGLSPVPTGPDALRMHDHAMRQSSAPRRIRQDQKRRTKSSSNSVEYQEVLSLAKVSANFSMGLDELYRKPTNAWSVESNSNSSGYQSLSGLSSTASTRSALSDRSSKKRLQNAGGSNTERKVQSLEYLPSMLLPTARPRRRKDFAAFVKDLRSSSVIPNDPRVPIVLASGASVTSGSVSDQEDNSDVLDTFAARHNTGVPTREPHQRPNSASSFISLSSISSVDMNDQSLEQHNLKQESHKDNYLDNFADNNVANLRWKMLRSKMLAKKRRKESKEEGERSQGEEHSDDIECPICAAAAKKFGGGQRLLNWLLDKWSPSSRLEQQNKLPLSPHSNNQRGVTPHFCNFVRKVRLNEKENEKPLADHSHVHSHVHSSHNNESDLLDATSNSLNIGSSWGRRSNTAWSAVRSVSEVNEPPESIFTPRNESYEGEEADAQTNWPDVEEALSPASSLNGVHASTPKPQSPTPPAPVSEKIDSRPTSPSKSPNRPASVSSGMSRAEIRIPTPRPESPGEEVTGIDDKDVKPEHDGSDVTDEATTKKSVPPPPPPKLTRPTVKEEPHEGPNQHTNEATKKQRAPIKKKERKPFERQRRTQEEEEEVGEAMEEEEKQPEQKEKIPEPIPEPPAPKVIETPELPTFKKEKKEEVKRVPSRAERHAIPVVPPVQIKQPEQTESMRDARKAFELNLPEMSKEDVNIQRPKVQPWLQGRLALSQQSCRFELPIDMRVLEKLSAVDYLRSYCVITTRRETLYQKIHGRYKDRTGKVSVKDLEKALRDVLINTITKEDIKRICEVVGLNAESAIEYKLFAGIAAMAERMLYPKFLTEDTQDKSEYKKEKIECADFSALEWKFHGVNVNPQVRRVLESL